MCACEPGFTCSRCAGTWLSDDYAELPDERADDERERYEQGGSSDDA